MFYSVWLPNLTLFSWLLLAKEPLTSQKLHHHYLLWDEISCDIFVVVVQSLNRVWLFVIPWTSAHQAPLSSTLSQSLIRFMSIESVMLSNHLILCYFLESEVTQSCLTLCDPMDCSLPGSFVYRIFQARVLEWVAISFSRRSSWPRDWTQVSRTVGRCFTVWATREVAPTKSSNEASNAQRRMNVSIKNYRKCINFPGWLFKTSILGLEIQMLEFHFKLW